MILVKFLSGDPDITQTSVPGDLVLAFAFFVTELLFINFPHALSKLATKPLSLAKAVNTNVLYFL